MKVVVSHLYHDRDVFLRELLSNSGDALEKQRFASLTDPKVRFDCYYFRVEMDNEADRHQPFDLKVMDSAPALNITILADAPSKRLIIRGKI
jgi:heat shock protein beta